MSKSLELLDRRCVVTVGLSATGPNGFRATDLDVKFAVKKNLKPEPNTCDLQIWNLNPDHRNALSQVDTAPVMIEAGYASGTSIIFLGDLRTGGNAKTSTDWITTISSGGSEKKHRKKRVNISVKRQSTADSVLKQVAAALGVGEGNISKAVSQLKVGNIGNMFSEGTVISGNAAREMYNICRSVGLTYSVQDGKLQLLPLKTALDGEALNITSNTGMIGSPTVDNKGLVKVRILIQPDVFPGRKLVLDSFRIEGQYRIETTHHVGDTAGKDWYIDIEAKRY